MDQAIGRGPMQAGAELARLFIAHYAIQEYLAVFV